MAERAMSSFIYEAIHQSKTNKILLLFHHIEQKTKTVTQADRLRSSKQLKIRLFCRLRGC
jgi:hypothetical protein